MNRLEPRGLGLKRSVGAAAAMAMARMAENRGDPSHPDPAGKKFGLGLGGAIGTTLMARDSEKSDPRRTVKVAMLATTSLSRHGVNDGTVEPHIAAASLSILGAGWMRALP